MIGDAEEVHWQFDAHLDKLAILHDTIANLEDAATELTLSMVCAGLSKVNHLLRVSGDILHTTLTDRHDALQRAILSRVLGGDLPDDLSDKLRVACVMVASACAPPPNRPFSRSSHPAPKRGPT